jgi:hypothetical protein
MSDATLVAALPAVAVDVAADVEAAPASVVSAVPPVAAWAIVQLEDAAPLLS